MTHRFVQSCPTCGRKLEIQVDLLGREVACQHCHAEFVAADATSTVSVLDDDAALLARVDQMLEKADTLLSAGDNDSNLTFT